MMRRCDESTCRFRRRRKTSAFRKREDYRSYGPFDPPDHAEVRQALFQTPVARRFLPRPFLDHRAGHLKAEFPARGNKIPPFRFLQVARPEFTGIVDMEFCIVLEKRFFEIHERSPKVSECGGLTGAVADIIHGNGGL